MHSGLLIEENIPIELFKGKLQVQSKWTSTDDISPPKLGLC